MLQSQRVEQGAGLRCCSAAALCPAAGVEEDFACGRRDGYEEQGAGNCPRPSVTGGGSPACSSCKSLGGGPLARPSPLQATGSPGAVRLGGGALAPLCPLRGAGGGELRAHEDRAPGKEQPPRYDVTQRGITPPPPRFSFRRGALPFVLRTTASPASGSLCPNPGLGGFRFRSVTPLGPAATSGRAAPRGVRRGLLRLPFV